MTAHRPRDVNLIDALEAVESVPYSETVWRVTRDGRDPCACSKPGGRWDDESFEVLYTAEESDGAIAEMYFHLSQGNPVVPSKVRYHLHELNVSADTMLDLSNRAVLGQLGVVMEQFGKMLYTNRHAEYVRTQAIGEVVHFLGKSSIRVPNARHDSSSNIVLFCDAVAPDQMIHRKDHGRVDFNEWKASLA